MKKNSISGETKFFREIKTFNALKLIIERENLKEFSVWSAACSTGEEPYSLAILFYEMGLNSNNVKIYATDMNRNFLKIAKSGIYSLEILNRSERKDIHKYFEKINDNRYQIIPQLKSYTIFSYFNLLDFFTYNNFKNKFKFIFLRNVLIYFDLDSANKILKNISSTLREDGYLFLGAKEVLANTDIFNKNYYYDIIYYTHSKNNKKVDIAKSLERKSDINKVIANDRKIKRKNKSKLSKNIYLKFHNRLSDEHHNKLNSEHYLAKGLKKEMENNIEMAKKYYKMAISMDLSSPFPHLFLANIYYQEKRYKEAYQEYLAAMKGLENKINAKYVNIFSDDEIEFFKNFVKNRIGI